MRAKKQIPAVLEEVNIEFDDYGIHVTTGNQSSNLKWKKIQGVSKKPTMIIILATNQNGFVLTNQVLGTQKESFYEYLISKIKQY